MNTEHASRVSMRVKAPSFLRFCSIQLALAAVSFAVADVVADTPTDTHKNDPTSQVNIEASRSVNRKTVGMTYTGIPIEELQLTRRVGYSDLDLASPSGAKELEKRIEQTAREACKQLDSLYPLEVWLTDRETCVKQAIDGAMAQAKTAIAAAAQKNQQAIRSATASPKN